MPGPGAARRWRGGDPVVPSDLRDLQVERRAGTSSGRNVGRGPHREGRGHDRQRAIMPGQCRRLITPGGQLDLLPLDIDAVEPVAAEEPVYALRGRFVERREIGPLPGYVPNRPDLQDGHERRRTRHRVVVRPAQSRPRLRSALALVGDHPAHAQPVIPEHL